MWIPDMRQDAGLLVGVTVALAAVSPAYGAENYVIGRCITTTHSRGTEISPVVDGGGYLVDFHGNDPRYKEGLSSGQFFSNSKITLIKAPAHGRVVLESDSDAASNGWYHYWPQDGYVGKDRFAIQVEKDGVKVRIQYMVKGLDEDEASEGVCNPDTWKISATSPELDNTNLQTLLGAADLGNGVTVDIAKLASGAVGQTTGTTITLDANAAGYGWFIDYTPTTNTHPPVRHYGWGAKAGRS